MRLFRWNVPALLIALAACGPQDKVLESTSSDEDPATSADAGVTINNDAGDTNGPTPAMGPSTPGTDAGTGSSNMMPTSGAVAKDADCDLNGFWIAKQLTRSVALGLSQFANNWYFLWLAQDGEQVTVIDHLDCGVVVRGDAGVGVTLTRKATEVLAKHNSQIGRKGQMAKQADGTCRFSMERFWSVRGVSEAKYLPTPRSRVATLDQLAKELPLPTPGVPNGAEDWDEDGKLGIAWQVTGAVRGTRNSVQRDYTEWESRADEPIKASLTWSEDVVVGARFNVEEIVFDPSMGLLSQGATPDSTAPHTMRLRLLGRSANDNKVKTLLAKTPIDRCMEIQAALPPEAGF